jgi:tRNA threonylcarbamoyladenosine biosynthesis protein TsaE
MAEVHQVESEEAMRALGASLLCRLKPGDAVLLEGELGAGKTTLARGLIEAAGWTEPVRSPTFNLIQEYNTEPPVLHADLYRLKSAFGIGLEDSLETHVCLIEWPDRLGGLIDAEEAYLVEIEFDEPGRLVTITEPS